MKRILVVAVKWRHRVNGLVNEHSYAANQNEDHSIHLLKILGLSILTIKLSLWNQFHSFQWVFCRGICNVNGLYFLTLKSQRPITVIFWAFLNLFSMVLILEDYWFVQLSIKQICWHWHPTPPPLNQWGMTRRTDSGTLMMEWMLKIHSQGKVCSLQAVFKIISPILSLYFYKNNIEASSANGSL